MNINGNGTYTSKIDRLIADYEAKINALRLARELIYGEVREKKTQRNDALAMALHHEATNGERLKHHARSHHRRYVRGPYQKNAPEKTLANKGKLASQRQRSADFLALFDRKKPGVPPTVTGSERGPLGIMVRRGYLKKKGDGYIRTAKPFHVKASLSHPSKKRTERDRRQETADYLAQFDREAPRYIKSRSIPSLLKGGYLTHKGDGYVRTAKEFMVVRA